MLEDKPSNAVDLLETSLLVKKTAFDAAETSALVPISVRTAPCGGFSCGRWDVQDCAQPSH